MLEAEELIVVEREKNGTHAIGDAEAKLRWRARLPGASVWDKGAHQLRVLQAQNHSAVSLLPLAMPLSWMVNAKASSVLVQRWLAPPCIESWVRVLDLIGVTMGGDDWLALGSAEKAIVAEAIAVLANVDTAQGSSLAAVTKVLALLRPQLVPLMDDAAIWFALDAVDEPTTADKPMASAELFVPMLDWFSKQALAQEKPLTALAAAHDLAILDAPQVLDRLLWMESWGNRLRT